MLALMLALVSNWPGSDSTCESRAFDNSLAVNGLAIMARISLKVSDTAGPVTSVRTPAAIENGPGWLRYWNCERTPYV